MFPLPPSGTARSKCFPRIRGDVPTVNFAGLLGVAFSPHTRGCSYSTPTVGKTPGVFPAYAGMFLRRRKDHRCHLGFPRIRGDVPAMLSKFPGWEAFSPHTRGCSVLQPNWGQHRPVFPAYAGMFPEVFSSPMMGVSFPRIRGDVPMRM